MGFSVVCASESETKKWGPKLDSGPIESLYFHSLKERNEIVMEHLPQVRYIARRIHDHLPQFVSLEDLVQSGVLGLMEALHNFDPGKKVQLKSYAKDRIRGAILDSLRELDWGPRTLRRKARQIGSARQTLSARLGRAPSEAELASEMGMTLKKFQRLLGELHGLEVVSLQAACLDDAGGNEELSCTPHSMEEDPSSVCLRSEMHGLLARALIDLPGRKRQVLALYYCEELTMKEVGARLGVGESRVSQIHSAALARLRARMRQLLESRVRQQRLGPRNGEIAAWKRPQPLALPGTAATRAKRGPHVSSAWGEPTRGTYLEPHSNQPERRESQLVPA